VNGLESYRTTRSCDADAALSQSRFLMVVLSTEVSRYASPRSPIGEYLTGLDSAFVPSPDSPDIVVNMARPLFSLSPLAERGSG
jgi:hypothetical protein